MATPYPELEIGLHRVQSGGFQVELRFADSSSDAERAPVRASCALDPDALLTLELDPERYGRALSEQVFANQEVIRFLGEVKATVARGDQPLRLRLRLLIDPSAADLNALRWELLCDPDTGAPYAVPADNPFVATAGAEPEIWAWGLRNPFKIAFDRATGDLYIGDVGQAEREEIDVGLATRGGGENYGWNTMEGTACYRPPTGCDTSGLTLPVLEYGHDQGCSVTGGVLYAGCRMPELVGTYFYSDFCTGFVRSFRLVGGSVTEAREWSVGNLGRVSSFGVDAEGEVYVVSYGGGEVYRLEPAS